MLYFVFFSLVYFTIYWALLQVNARTIALYFFLQTKPILKVKQFLLFQSQMTRVSEILQFSNKL
ncbi:hypothetical protein C5O69_01180 [Streptococcus pseudopneumoniae]|uniref:Uncharacterized protein n=1 Tax=Streptococcus pseudopneumoniae TaxID=257758 RepID=A0A3A4NA02_9STRE|nr:hypothetical protein C5O69_01180 [Streptococcus pseudopneumoniae]